MKTPYLTWANILLASILIGLNTVKHNNIFESLGYSLPTFLLGAVLGIIPEGLFMYFYNLHRPDNKVKIGIPERTTVGLIIAILLCVLWSPNIIGRSSKNTGTDKTANTANRNSSEPTIASKMAGLSAQELKHIQELSDKTGEIARKYLTPDEYDQFASISRKIAQGIVTADEIARGNFLWNKMNSLSSPSEKETLDEMNRIGQKISERIQNIPGEVASPKPRGNVLIELLLAPISFIRDPVGYLNNYPFYITIWVIALIWYGLRQRKRSKALKDKISDQKKKAF